MENESKVSAEARGSESRADWYVSLKNAQGRWMEVITVSDRTRAEAEKHAKEALHYYEGTTDWRVSLTPNNPGERIAADKPKL